MSELLESLEASRANCNFLKSKLDELSLEFMGLQDENDALRKKLEIAVEALEYYDQKEDYQIGTVAYRALTIIRPAKNNEALAEIEKMNNQLV
jgi:regulator of replication initiation timing